MSYIIQSNSLRGFIELRPFRRYLDSLSDGPQILQGVQKILLENPEEGNVIQGTGGLRKMRYGGVGIGKRGGYRVIYLYQPRFEKIYLFTIYSKSEHEDLSLEHKNHLKAVVEILKRGG